MIVDYNVLHKAFYHFLMVHSTMVLLTLDHKTSAYFIQEGDICMVPKIGKTGECIKLSECDYAKQLIRKRKGNPGFCGFVGNHPLVCCPVEKEPGRLSKEMCENYYKLAKTNVAMNAEEHILTKEFPHMVAVGYGSSKTATVWLCGGSLISHYFVLSAAHCLYSITFGPARWIRLETFGIKNLIDDATPYDIKIKESYIYPNYTRSSFYHDVTLFKLEEKINFNSFIYPACLHIPKDVPVDILQATGWGTVQDYFGFSRYLMEVNLHIVDHRTCSSEYATVTNWRKLKDGILDELQICAGDAMGQDTMPGDSGGPLQYQVKKNEETLPQFKIVGITSFGKWYGMASSVGVYTRVSAYVDWIESIVWEEGENV